MNVRVVNHMGVPMTTANKNLYTMCEGCTIYGYITTLKDDLDIYHRDCDIEYPVLSDCQCPCINCLVKGICEDICDEFSEFKDKSKQAVSAKVKEYKGVKMWKGKKRP
jgi:hypothetical protein